MTPRLRRLLSGVAAIAAGVLALLLGVAPTRSGALAVGVALLLVVVGETRIRPDRWPPPLPGPTRSAWTEVEQLADILAVADTDPRRFDGVVRRRLRGLASNALAGAGVGWESARAAELLGGTLWEALDADDPAPDLSGPAHGGLARSTLVARTLDAVDRIGRDSGTPTAGGRA